MTASETRENWRGDRAEVQTACPRCHSLTVRDAQRCFDCDVVKPATGWVDVRELADPFLGRTIDSRYLVTKPIGHGSSGEVYRVESLTIPRRFAIKFITIPGAPESERARQTRERIRRETEAVLGLKNPHVIRIYDVIDIDPRVVAVVMELIDGPTLEDLTMNAGRLEPRRAIEITRQIANGLYEAHAAGLIHRDVKPENIMVERMPAGDDFIHILDFGIVWARGSEHFTQGFIGTPLYASPDQAMGLELDHRSDIYSLGATLFFMLAGRPPFQGGSPMKILHEHVTSTPPGLREFCDDELGIEELAALVEEMMQKSPDDRPDDLARVIEKLDKIEREVFQTNPPEISTVPARSVQSTSRCAVRVAPQRGRVESDVPCMTRVGIGRTPDHFALTHTHFALSCDDEIFWGSLLEDGVSEESITVEGVSALALVDTGILAGTRDGRILQIRKLDEDPEVLCEIDAEIFMLSSDPACRLVVGVTDRGIFVKRGSQTRLIETSEATSCVVSRSASQFGVGYEDGSVRIWRAPEYEVGQSIQIADAPIEKIAFSRGDYLIAALADGEVFLEAPLTQSRVFSLADFAADVEDIAFTRSDHLMAVAARDGEVFVLDLQCRFATTCSPDCTSCDRR